MNAARDSAIRNGRFVCQHTGPRGRRYGIPVALEKAELLARFYTDFCLPRSLGTVGQLVVPRALQPAGMQAVFGRTLPEGLPLNRVRSFPFETWKTRLTKGPGASDSVMADYLRDRILADDFASADGLYTTINGDLELAAEARTRGMTVVHDQVLNPDSGLIVREERSRFPGIEPQESEGVVQGGIERDQALWRLADLVLAPSEFARDAIARLGGDPEKTVIVRYGISKDWLKMDCTPERGRILFVGSVGLRKGTHYLAHATRRLHTKGIKCRVRVVGGYNPAVIGRPEFRGPEYVGRLARNQIWEEFRRASVFVHPSLSEGSAIAHLEALACGLPVVVTPNVGSVIRDQYEGFIVPARDSHALSERLEALVTDPDLRETMSQAARESAKAYTWEAYSRRLSGALIAFAGGARGDGIGS